ncbi:MAG: 30S ribosomal protein S16 [Clostridia bacterium]|nr:30S ribosomal protein S16 [Clostridia bacterium]
MLMIKLSKIGKTNKKVFRLIISEKGRDPYGRALEILGAYNPYTKELTVKGDRIKYWISKGAGMTASVNNLLVGQSIVEGKKVVASKKGKINEKKLAQSKAKDDKKKIIKEEKEATKITLPVKDEKENEEELETTTNLEENEEIKKVE